MVDFSDPRTLALLGGGSALLQAAGASPRPINLAEGLGSAFPAAMQGMMAGRQMQHQDLLLRQQQDAAMRKLQQEQILRDTLAKQATGKTDLRALGDSLIATGIPEFIKQGLDFHRAAPKAKSSVKVMNDRGQAVYQPFMDTGEFGPVSELPAAERLMQINRGSQIDLANPYTGQAQTSLAVGMNPGQAASLAQGERQFNQSHNLAQQNADINRQIQLMKLNPEFQANNAVAKQQALNTLAARKELPGIIDKANESINLIDNLIGNKERNIPEHPGLRASVGGSAPLGQLTAFVHRGSNEADFARRMEQIGGQQFLQAFETLKGGGQITEVEGQKATQAISRMNTSSSEPEFIKAAQEFREIVNKGLERAQNAAGVAPAANSRRSTISSGGFSATRND